MINSMNTHENSMKYAFYWSSGAHDRPLEGVEIHHDLRGILKIQVLRSLDHQQLVHAQTTRDLDAAKEGDLAIALAVEVAEVAHHLHRSYLEITSVQYRPYVQISSTYTHIIYDILQYIYVCHQLNQSLGHDYP